MLYRPTESGVLGWVDKMVIYFVVTAKAAEGCYYYEFC